jgi:hypothetical protein
MKRRHVWYALLLLPIAGALLPGIYNRIEPTLFDLPFFYWYQLAWVIATSLVLAAVVYATRERNDV